MIEFGAALLKEESPLARSDLHPLVPHAHIPLRGLGDRRCGWPQIDWLLDLSGLHFHIELPVHFPNNDCLIVNAFVRIHNKRFAGALAFKAVLSISVVAVNIDCVARVLVYRRKVNEVSIVSNFHVQGFHRLVDNHSGTHGAFHYQNLSS